MPLPNNATEVVVDPTRNEIFPATLPVTVGLNYLHRIGLTRFES